MLKTLAIGLPVMLLCRTIQASLTGLSVQHFLRRITPGAPQMKTLANIRLLMAAMLILMLGNLLQIAIWGALFVWRASLPSSLRRFITRRSITPRSVTAIS